MTINKHNPSSIKFFIDMDGVVADFVGGVCNHFGISPDFSKAVGNYEFLYEATDCTPSEFWTELDKNAAFWSKLNLYPHAHDLVMLCTERVGPKNVYFLTSPALNPLCFSGKAEWIHKYFPAYIRNLILTPHKHFFAKFNHVLIDDSDANIAPFKLAGGKTILFPQPWNSAHSESARQMFIVTRDIKRYAS